MTSLVERLRRRVNKPDGTKRRPSPRELEAADAIEALCEALTRISESSDIIVQHYTERDMSELEHSIVKVFAKTRDTADAALAKAQS